MIGFFIAATLLLLVVLALVAYPLMRGPGRAPEDRRGDVVALGRERFEELKQKERSGEISAAEYEERVADLEAQLADDLHSQRSSDSGPGRSGGQWIGIVVIVFIPILSGLLYLSLGQPRALFQDTRPVAGGGTVDGEHPVEIQAMVSRLAARLKDNPEDAEGWFMLGRSYMVLNRYREAVDAFRRLRELVGNAPEILLREATALALTRDGSLSGEPLRLVELALQQRPDHPQALWLAATAAYQAADYQTALDYYRRVEPLTEGETRQQVQNMIRELVARGYGQAAAEEPAGKEPAAENKAAAGDDSGTSLKVNVTLSPSLQSDAAGEDTVFIFVKAVNGPPMPLAVVRKTVSQLPLTVTLDDSQAMMPQLKLSGFDQVTVRARISSSGRPTAQPGDLEGESPPISTSTPQTVEVTIDRVVPE